MPSNYTEHQICMSLSFRETSIDRIAVTRLAWYVGFRWQFGRGVKKRCVCEGRRGPWQY